MILEKTWKIINQLSGKRYKSQEIEHIFYDNEKKYLEHLQLLKYLTSFLLILPLSLIKIYLHQPLTRVHTLWGTILLLWQSQQFIRKMLFES